MNQLRAWLYGYDASSTSRLRNESYAESDQITGHFNTQVNEENGNGLKPPESSLKQAILKVIPLTPGDCLECKLVGSGVMMLSGIIVITSAMTASTRQTISNKVPLRGPRKTLYYAICGGLFVAFETAAICRLLDIGPFTKHTRQAAQS